MGYNFALSLPLILLLLMIISFLFQDTLYTCEQLPLKSSVIVHYFLHTYYKNKRETSLYTDLAHLL